jgi:hypothetical protein
MYIYMHIRIYREYEAVDAGALESRPHTEPGWDGDHRIRVDRPLDDRMKKKEKEGESKAKTSKHKTYTPLILPML